MALKDNHEPWFNSVVLGFVIRNRNAQQHAAPGRNGDVPVRRSKPQGASVPVTPNPLPGHNG